MGQLLRCHRISGLLHFIGKSITNSVNGLDIGGSLGLRFDFFADTPNIHIDAAWRNTAIITPNAVQKLIARKDHSRVRPEIVQKAKLQCTEIDAATCHGDAVRGRINKQFPPLEQYSLWYIGLMPP